MTYLKDFKNNGFTLIELLVVVAIIGILASIVITSLNTARNKGKEAAIKSNLKNAIAQAELSYLDNNSYSGACDAIAPMLDSITNSGAFSACYSVDREDLNDVYTRWGASGIVGTSTPIFAISSSPMGAVTWDTQGVNSSGTFTGTPEVPADAFMNWNSAINACTNTGGRLPSIEELKSLHDASYLASGNTNHTPPGFAPSGYWSNTTVPSNSDNAYGVGMATGNVGNASKVSGSNYVRCVR